MKLYRSIYKNQFRFVYNLWKMKQIKIDNNAYYRTSIIGFNNNLSMCGT